MRARRSRPMAEECVVSAIEDLTCCPDVPQSCRESLGLIAWGRARCARARGRAWCERAPGRRRVRPDLVVVEPPARAHAAGVSEAFADLLVQELFPPPADEALDEGVSAAACPARCRASRARPGWSTPGARAVSSGPLSLTMMRYPPLASKALVWRRLLRLDSLQPARCGGERRVDEIDG